ncbi:MAG: DNA-3-methyladenine glycosylase [Dermatophilaceae bacterium]
MRIRLAHDDLAGPVLEVAPSLLGCRLVHAGVVVRLTEVEAYAGDDDPGSHAFRGRTPRTELMFGRAGRLYVYFTYGMHWCANVVTGVEGRASAVLLRAGEVVDGVGLARQRRPGASDRDLARGPARLARSAALGRAENGLDLVAPDAPAWLEAPDAAPPPSAVRTGPRVGVSGAGGDGDRHPWRLWIDGEPTVSAYRPGRPGRRSLRP